MPPELPFTLPDPDRYEIRPLQLEHENAVRAILAHSMAFHSPMWTPMYPRDQAELAYALFKAWRPAVRCFLEAGLSFGGFDKHYTSTYADPAPNTVGWDHTNTEASSETLLAQMDFPLSSVALFKDAAHHVPAGAM
ncbi:hypothetical protein C8A03DRAFT_19220 [Achaetomium macrosporum]|uniref:Uncharacterized protein n=1 Tax=Achaetomium macrosporum TaxID=79813 RepID=A0AAN7C3F4_9PEZI|nr:hypothetical protein C8A03DRAFT_19220 [Achaetomium macrosporum]